MAEGMTNEDIAFHEQRNTGTSPTKNKFFDDNGYIPFESIIDPKDLSVQFQKREDKLIIGEIN